MMVPSTSPVGLRPDPQMGVESEHEGPDAGKLEALSEPENTAPPVMPPSQFLAALGRELSTPLNTMMNMAGFLLESELTRDQHQMVADFHVSGQRLLRLVSDALDAVEAGTGPVQRASIPFDLRVLEDETATLLRPRARKKGQSVECRVHHEVPSRLVGDPGRLRQVLWNLGEHLLESHGPGGVVLRVARLHEDAGSVMLRFELLFYSAGQMGLSTSDHARGGQEATDPPDDVANPSAGLRLAIAQRLVGVMGTRVVAEVEPGRDEHAWFDLKLDKQKEASPEGVPAIPPEGLAGHRVLVVDPTEAIRHGLAKKLENWGCLVSEAERAEDAMMLVEEAATAQAPFRFVLVERDLPWMSAHELGAYLRAQSGGDALRMVLFAGVGRPGDLDVARASGFDAYLPKHIDGQALGDALAELERVALSSPAREERPLVTRHWLAEARRSRMRILIVEDDVVSTLVTDWTLRRIGFQVARVNSAGEMRRLLEGDPARFDLVLLAMRLPDSDGLSIVREIRSTGPQGQSPAIVALGYECTRVERDRCHAAGVDAYIPRPVDLGHLCEIVEKLTRTAPPGGKEAEDLISDGTMRTAWGRRPGDERDRVSFRFEVDTSTGAVLGAGRQVMDDVLAVAGLDDAMAASIELMVPATDVNPAMDHSESRADEPPARQGCDDSLPALDLARLEAASMKSPAVRTGMLSAYLQRARAGLDRIGPAVSSGDVASVEAQAHLLTLMATSLGAVSCSEVFNHLEKLAREGSVAGVAPLVSRAYAELARVERLAAEVGQETQGRA